MSTLHWTSILKMLPSLIRDNIPVSACSGSLLHFLVIAVCHTCTLICQESNESLCTNFNSKFTAFGLNITTQILHLWFITYHAASYSDSSSCISSGQCNVVWLAHNLKPSCVRVSEHLHVTATYLPSGYNFHFPLLHQIGKNGRRSSIWLSPSSSPCLLHSWVWPWNILNASLVTRLSNC